MQLRVEFLESQCLVQTDISAKYVWSSTNRIPEARYPKLSDPFG